MRDKKQGYIFNINEMEGTVLQFKRLITADKFFNILSSHIDFNSMKPEKKYEYYSMDLGESFPAKNVLYGEKFVFDSGEWIELTDENSEEYEDNIGRIFYFYGWKKVSENSYTGTDYKLYFYY